jgi:hypothetical protein
MVTLRKGLSGRTEPPSQPPPALATSSQARKPGAAARASWEPVHTHTNRSSVSLPRPAPRTAAPSPRSRAEPEEPRRCATAPQTRAAPSRAALSWWGAYERDTRQLERVSKRAELHVLVLWISCCPGKICTLARAHAPDPFATRRVQKREGC